jgi:hypothetical protein
MRKEYSTSNGKNKGKGNRKNGNKYLSGICRSGSRCKRYHPVIERYYQKKLVKTNKAVAAKAVSNSWPATYYVLKIKS